VARLRRYGRIALCGQIATYDHAADNRPPDRMRIINGAIRLQGFLIPDFADRTPQALEQLSEGIASACWPNGKTFVTASTPCPTRSPPCSRAATTAR
jgi:NADPH-dependent curcumin reductase CurA